MENTTKKTEKIKQHFRSLAHKWNKECLEHVAFIRSNEEIIEAWIDFCCKHECFDVTRQKSLIHALNEMTEENQKLFYSYEEEVT